MFKITGVEDRIVFIDTSEDLGPVLAARPQAACYGRLPSRHRACRHVPFSVPHAFQTAVESQRPTES